MQSDPAAGDGSPSREQGVDDSVEDADAMENTQSGPGGSALAGWGGGAASSSISTRPFVRRPASNQDRIVAGDPRIGAES